MQWEPEHVFSKSRFIVEEGLYSMAKLFLPLAKKSPFWTVHFKQRAFARGPCQVRPAVRSQTFDAPTLFKLKW